VKEGDSLRFKERKKQESMSGSGGETERKGQAGVIEGQPQHL